MIKPKRLKRGDKVAVVSLSSGMPGERRFRHKYELGKQRLEKVFKLEVVTMPHALKGIRYLYEHPEKRAEDFMAAMRDPEIKAVITTIGGDDTIRLLPYVDIGILRENPKIFMGFSDTTANHLMMYRAGVVSYYGPALMSDFGEYGAMHDYTIRAIKELLFEAKPRYEIKKCDYWIKDMPAWQTKNIDIVAKKVPDKKGYEVLQGRGKVAGKLLGGCLDALPMAIGTEIWPGPEDWNGALLFFEISDDISNPDHIAYILRNLGVQGILGSAAGMIIGKPKGEKHYDEYKTVFRQVLKEFVREDIPVLYNVNFGHCQPIGIIPYGIQCELDVDRKTITLLESVVE